MNMIKPDGDSTTFVSSDLPQFFAVAFFLMLFALGIGSLSADAGTIIAVISDKYPSVKRWKIVTGICVGGFLLGSIYVTPVRGPQIHYTFVNANNF